MKVPFATCSFHARAAQEERLIPTAGLLHKILASVVMVGSSTFLFLPSTTAGLKMGNGFVDCEAGGGQGQEF